MKQGNNNASYEANGFWMSPIYYDAIRKLPDGDRLKLYDALMASNFGGELVELPPILAGYLQLINATIDLESDLYGD